MTVEGWPASDTTIFTSFIKFEVGNTLGIFVVLEGEEMCNQ